MNTTLLINYIDQLRQKRNLRLDVFIENIISQRQYSRYKKGVNDVPFDVISKLSNRLNISLGKVITEFEFSINNEVDEVVKFFNFVVRKQLAQAKQLDTHLAYRKFINNDIRQYYKISKLLLIYYEQEINQETLLNALKKETRYPNILKNTSLSEHEIYALGLIMQYDKNMIPPILEKLLTLNQSDHFTDVKNPYVTILNQFFIIKNLGRLKRYEQVIIYADKTIQFCQESLIHYMLHKIYYYKALAYHYLDKKELFEAALKDTIIEALRKPKEEQERFFLMIEKDTKINPKSFIKDKLFK
ncbi:MAG: helix-turn-helix domain-containing protein [Bacillota bacterium]